MLNRLGDLTKLTAEEFSSLIENCDPELEEKFEIRRRLERLEQCETVLRAKPKLEDADYRLGQALRVARRYKAQLERCEALAREGK